MFKQRCTNSPILENLQTHQAHSHPNSSKPSNLQNPTYRLLLFPIVSNYSFSMNTQTLLTCLGLTMTTTNYSDYCIGFLSVLHIHVANPEVFLHKSHRLPWDTPNSPLTSPSSGSWALKEYKYTRKWKHEILNF